VARSFKHVSLVKATSNTYSEYVFVALGISHAMRMRLIILSPVTCQAVKYVSTLSHKGTDFEKNVFEHEIYIF
jgi:hypothetical protein